MIVRHLLATAMSALMLSNVASAQCPAVQRGEPDGWPSMDISGQPAPMTFGEFHRSRLSHARAIDLLTAAGCKRHDLPDAIRFDCKSDPNTWYLTLPGPPAHPGLVVAPDAEDKNALPNVAHGRLLSETGLPVLEPAAPEKLDAFRAWRMSLPVKPKWPPSLWMDPPDWELIFSRAPVARDWARTLGFDEMLSALNAAEDCRRTTGASYIVVDCALSNTRWYATREGEAAHPAIALKGHSAGTRDGSDTLLSSRTYPGPNGAKSAGLDALKAWEQTLPDCPP